MSEQLSGNTLTGQEKDIRQRLLEALRRFGYKQVDVSKETSNKVIHQKLILRYPSLYIIPMASGEN